MVTSDLFDPDLARRYDHHGPRYTSYPTAAQFHTGFGASDYRRAALLSNASPAKSLSIYAHIPSCASDRVIARSQQRSTDYAQHLLTEIELQAALFDRRRRVRQLNFGGGTLTFLTIDELGRIISVLGERFSLDLSSHRQLSIEIDPRAVRAGTFPDLARLGFNSLSFGIQEFDPQVEAFHRHQSAAQVAESLRQARAAGFRSVSLDLPYGLPLQTLASFSDTLDRVIELCPDRIAAHDYAHLPDRLRARRAIDTQQPPGGELRPELHALTVRKLTAAGYVHIGMDHFALPDDDLTAASLCGGLRYDSRGYSMGADCDLVGLGVSAISCVGGSYAQNCKSLSTYMRALSERRLPMTCMAASYSTYTHSILTCIKTGAQRAHLETSRRKCGYRACSSITQNLRVSW